TFVQVERTAGVQQQGGVGAGDLKSALPVTDVNERMGEVAQRRLEGCCEVGAIGGQQELLVGAEPECCRAGGRAGSPGRRAARSLRDRQAERIAGCRHYARSASQDIASGGREGFHPQRSRDSRYLSTCSIATDDS